VPKIIKKEAKPYKRVPVVLGPGEVAEVECGEGEYVLYYSNAPVSRAGGDFVEACFRVEKYIICFTKEEIEGVCRER
jgi:hypothetical protein